jgi:uncharacterized membrane protein HdeD (DUF308 family)
MLEYMARNWGVILARGIVAVLLGVAVLVWPSAAATTLVYLWGAYAVADGVMSLIMAFQSWPAMSNRWIMGLQGVVGIVAGIIAFVWPGMTAVALIYVVAFWAIFIGILEVIAAVELRKELTGEFWLGLSGVLSVVFGVLLFIYPSSGLLSLMWLLGIYAIVDGVSRIVLSLQLRGAISQGSTPQQMQPR